MCYKYDTITVHKSQIFFSFCHFYAKYFFGFAKYAYFAEKKFRAFRAAPHKPQTGLRSAAQSSAFSVYNNFISAFCEEGDKSEI